MPSGTSWRMVKCVWLCDTWVWMVPSANIKDSTCLVILCVTEEQNLVDELVAMSTQDQIRAIRDLPMSFEEKKHIRWVKKVICFLVSVILGTVLTFTPPRNRKSSAKILVSQYRRRKSKHAYALLSCSKPLSYTVYGSVHYTRNN